MDTIENNDTFARKKSVYDEGKRSKTRLDYSQELERCVECSLVGESEEGSGIYRTIEASNYAGIDDTIRDEEELEDLESRQCH